MEVYVHPEMFLLIEFTSARRKAKKRSDLCLLSRVVTLIISGNPDFLYNKDFIEVEKGMFLTWDLELKTPFDKMYLMLFNEIDGKNDTGYLFGRPIPCSGYGKRYFVVSLGLCPFRYD